MEETKQSNEYIKNIMQQMVEATGVPHCFICQKRIVGAHVDYMDTDRIPRKVCVGCVFQSIDYYIAARKRLQKDEKP